MLKPTLDDRLYMWADRAHEELHGLILEYEGEAKKHLKEARSSIRICAIRVVECLDDERAGAMLDLMAAVKKEREITDDSGK